MPTPQNLSGLHLNVNKIIIKSGMDTVVKLSL